MAAGTKKTWRVRGIDTRCTDLCLQQLARAADDSPEFKVDSLATEHHGRSQTATISFAQNITPPEALGPCPDHHGRRPVQLTLDDHFLGFTTLFAPSDEHHQIDIIAISGLGSHAFGSFKERGGDHMWLRDALPDHLVGQQSRRPMARVMIFGYDSPVANSSSMQNVADIASNLRLTLTALVSDDSPRPILVISHSPGGLIVKEAIIALAASRGDEDSEKLLRAIYGLVFFGVPHLGMDNTSLIPMTDLGPNLELVVSISQANSHFLTVQNREFPAALEALGGDVFCFYETQMSPTAQQVGGVWKMTGPEAILVSKASATTCALVADNRVQVCAINRPHSAIVKFAQQDEAYNVVLTKLRSLARGALDSAAKAGGTVPVPPEMTSPSPLAVRPSSPRSRARTRRPGAERDAAHNDQRLKVVHSIPMRENDNFTGRESVLMMLREAYFTNDADEKRRSTIALVGLGGIGKTQVALALSYWVKRHVSNMSIIWVSALSLDTFNQSCTSILRDLGVSTTGDEQQDAKQQLKDYLSKDPKAGNWLLILDNADDPTLLEDTPTRLGLCRYLPFHKNGITLITTRTEDAACTMVLSREIINLDLLDPVEARTLLEKSLGDKRPADYSENTSKQLLEALERLPLAITQAAAYLKRNQVSIRQYLGFLQGRWEEAVQLLSRELNPAEKWPPERQHYAVMTTWLVSLDAIKRHDGARNSSDAAIRLLLFLSQVEPKAIPLSMLPEVGGSAEVLTHTIGTLLRYSFLTKRDGDVYDIHSLVHLAIRNWVSRGKLLDKAMTEALGHLERVMPLSNPMARAVWTAYMPHALRALANSEHVQTDERFLLARRVASCLQQDGRSDDALNCSRLGLARAYGDLGQPQRAISVCKDILDSVTPEHDAYLPTRLHLAHIYSNMGERQQAISHYEYVAAAQSKTLPQEHQYRLNAEFDLAREYLDTGQVQRALPLLQHVIAVELRTLPPQHPALLTTQINLAEAHLANGETAAAVALFEHVLEAEKGAHPLHVFDYLSTQFILGEAYLAMANVDKAVAVLSDVVLSSESLPNEHQWFRLGALTLLQDVFNTVGDTEDAARLEADVEISRALWYAVMASEPIVEESSLADIEDEDEVHHPKQPLPDEMETPSGQDNLPTSSPGEERPSKRLRPSHHSSALAAQQDNPSRGGNPQQSQLVRRSARQKQKK